MFGLEKSRALATAAVILLLAATGFAVWKVLEERADSARVEAAIVKGLTEEELVSVFLSEAVADRPTIESISKSPEKRRAFIRGLKETLSLASQARRDGLADEEDFKINAAFKEKILIADLYQSTISRGKGRLWVVPEEQVNAVWKDRANELAFERDMAVLQRIRKEDAEVRQTVLPAPKLEGDILTKARLNWARRHVLWNMAKADKEFISQPALSLRVKLLEAGILSSDYLRVHAGDLRASESEISRYVAEHPEYDPKVKLEKAKKVLGRLKAGEEFEKVAKEVSEDRGSRDRGGIYEDVGTGVLWPEVEAKALTMKPGEVTSDFVESKVGYHLIQFISKSTSGDGGKVGDLTFTFRHILIQKKFEEPGATIPGIPRPFLSPEEIAKQEIEKKKRDELVASVLARNPISLPEDVEFELPPLTEKGESRATSETSN